ncbi:hypothetical protein CY34DRAFT_800592 [Suillus luteus UH-Slu-Lm8-n1]|uniref:C3H1-type domain-containing protein n=1 Tax=Suillus luteus UH-Slu-Lm8-n1 TaxID=930992 RepID=A0A0D0BJV4_9AGAM|nr:hypothetical protein CY34DRAFT_800592 [Suillus luteus UH-Slu-Lm8-n1]
MGWGYLVGRNFSRLTCRKGRQCGQAHVPQWTEVEHALSFPRSLNEANVTHFRYF